MRTLWAVLAALVFVTLACAEDVDIAGTVRAEIRAEIVLMEPTVAPTPVRGRVTVGGASYDPFGFDRVRVTRWAGNGSGLAVFSPLAEGWQIRWFAQSTVENPEPIVVMIQGIDISSTSSGLIPSIPHQHKPPLRWEYEQLTPFQWRGVVTVLESVLGAGVGLDFKGPDKTSWSANIFDPSAPPIDRRTRIGD